MRAVRRRAATVAAAALVALPTAAAAQEPSASEQDVPVVGTFSYAGGNDNTLPEVRGAVHGVRRVPGGTAVYYSLGGAAGPGLFDRVATMPTISLSEPYDVGDAFAVRVLDPEGLQLLLPLKGPDGCLCSSLYDFGDQRGQLTQGWAVVPPLPPGTDRVSVLVGFGSVEDVPVEDGPLEPTSAQVPLLLGDGWPVLPTQEQITAVGDPAPFVRDLVRRSADAEQTVTTSESNDAVDEALAADVLFAVGSATLSPAAQGTLQQVAARVRERAAGPVTVVGHTDATGDDASNQALSEARARAVRDALQAGVGTGVTLQASGRGEAEPVADNATEQGRQANRRVTVTYQVKEGA